MNRPPVYLLVFCLLPSLLWAQEDRPGERKQVQILNADVLEYEKRDGEEVKKLIGKVALLQDSTYFYADQAYIYDKRDFIDAEGNVHVVMTDSVELFADKATHDGKTKIVELYDNIRLIQPDRELKTDRMTYYRLQKYGFYPRNGQLTDSSNVLTSLKGYYYTDTDDAKFYTDVTLTGEEYVLVADTLFYNASTEVAFFVSPTCITGEDNQEMYTEGGWFDTKNEQGLLYDNPSYRDSSYFIAGDTLYYDDLTEQGWGKCDIQAENEDTTLILYGDSAFFNRATKETWIMNNPWAVNFYENDTAEIYADTLYAIDDSANGQQYLKAFHNAEALFTDIEAVADSMVYDRQDSMLLLFRKPIVWSGVNQVTGDTIKLWIVNEAIDSIAIYRNAFSVSLEIQEYFNQLKGLNMFGKFEDNQLVHLRVQGNAESLYFVEQSEDTYIYEGTNRTTGISADVFLEDNQPKKIKFNQNPEGTFLPMVESTGDKIKLEGFEWKVDRKPKRFLGAGAVRRFVSNNPDYDPTHYRDDTLHISEDSLPPAPDTTARDTSLASDSTAQDSVVPTYLPVEIELPGDYLPSLAANKAKKRLWRDIKPAHKAIKKRWKPAWKDEQAKRIAAGELTESEEDMPDKKRCFLVRWWRKVF
ncbi:MAG: OstA-like protein [Bacteroidota bacterium]